MYTNTNVNNSASITKHWTDLAPLFQLKYTFMCIICRAEQENHQLFLDLVVKAEGETGLRFCSKPGLA